MFLDRVSVRHKEHHHRRVSCSLVAIDERVVPGDPEGVGARHGTERRMEQEASEARLRLRDRGEEHSTVAQSGAATAHIQHTGVKAHYIFLGEENDLVEADG